MQIEIYNMQTENDSIKITLEAICDSFSSLLWDIRDYECGQFEIYIAASPQNIEIFQTGRIIGRDDDPEHFGIIESVKIDTDADNDNSRAVDQSNNSSKALSRLEIYRQTRNALKV